MVKPPSATRCLQTLQSLMRGTLDLLPGVRLIANCNRTTRSFDEAGRHGRICVFYCIDRFERAAPRAGRIWRPPFPCRWVAPIDATGFHVR
jgi:hypothetical protein